MFSGELKGSGDIRGHGVPPVESEKKGRFGEGFLFIDGLENDADFTGSVGDVLVSKIRFDFAFEHWRAPALDVCSGGHQSGAEVTVSRKTDRSDASLTATGLLDANFFRLFVVVLEEFFAVSFVGEVFV